MDNLNDTSEVINNQPGITSLMRRIALFLEDGEFKKASEYIDRVLDINPEYAPAYAAKVCADLGLHKEADLAETTFQYDDNLNWQKALRFADMHEKKNYESYAAKVKKRVERQIRNYTYDCAIAIAVKPDADKEKLDNELNIYRQTCLCSSNERADGSRRANSQSNEAAFEKLVNSNEPGDVSESSLKAAAEMFEIIEDEEAKERAAQCLVLAEQARQKAIYRDALSICKREFNSPVKLEYSAKQFLSIPDYQDAKEQAQHCIDEAEAIRSRAYEKAVTDMNIAGNDSDKWNEIIKKLEAEEIRDYKNVPALMSTAKKKYNECLAAEEEVRRQRKEMNIREKAAAEAKTKRNKFIVAATILIIAVGIYVVTQIIIPGNNYKDAVALQKAGKYEEAIERFASLGDYSDSRDKILECQNGIKEGKYQAAVALQKSEKFEEAITVYEEIADYSDSMIKINECRNGIKERQYQAAVALQQSGNYENAISAFEYLGDYRDSATKIVECEDGIKERQYHAAIVLQQSGKYNEAISALELLGNYSDVETQIKETYYLQAQEMMGKKITLVRFRFS